MMELVILFCLALIGLWAVHGNTEANRVKLQNGSSHKNRLKRSANVKRLIQVQQAILILMIALCVQQITGLKTAAAFLFYAGASRWFFFELFYGHYHIKEWLFIGEGGKFDNEITSNKWLYFGIRAFVFVLSIVGMIWAL